MVVLVSGLVSSLFVLLWGGWMVVLVSGLVVAWSLSAALTLREGSLDILTLPFCVRQYPVHTARHPRNTRRRSSSNNTHRHCNMVCLSVALLLVRSLWQPARFAQQRHQEELPSPRPRDLPLARPLRLPPPRFCGCQALLCSPTSKCASSSVLSNPSKAGLVAAPHPL